MQRFLRSLLMLALVASLVPVCLNAQTAGEGRSFVLTLPFTTIATSYVQPRPRLILTSTSGATARLLYTATGATQDVVIAPGISEEVQVDSALVMLPDVMGTFSSTIQIAADAPIGVMMMLDRPFAAESFTAIPDTLLGFSYRAISSGQTEQGDFICVVGVQDGTTVTVQPSRALRDGRPAGAPIVFTLNRGQVHQLLGERNTDMDLTGTSIEADRPVGVFTGSSCADITAGVEHSCNPLLEQLPHADAWGARWAIGPLERQQVGLARIVARCNGTQVFVNGALQTTLDAGAAFQFSVDTIYAVTTSAPAMLAQMITSTSRGPQDRSEAYGDPSMAVVPPLEQWGRVYRVAIPSMAARTDAGAPVGWRHFLHVAVPSGGEPALLIDGAGPVWNRRLEAGGYVIGIQEVGPGDHTVTVAGLDSISVLSYGYSAADAYGAPLGPLLRRFALEAPPLLAEICGDTLDTTITVYNPGPSARRVEAVEFIGALRGSVLAPGFPIDIPARQRRTLSIRLRDVNAGNDHGYLVLRSTGCTERLAAIGIRLERFAPAFTPAAGSAVDFGVLPQAIPFADRVIQVRNTGRVPVTLSVPTVAPAEFSVISPSFPRVLAPGEVLDVVVRFTPSGLGRWSGSVSFSLAECDERWTFPLAGEQKQRSYITVGRPAAIRLLCPPKPQDTFAVTIKNEGDIPFDVTESRLDGTDIAEFRLLDDIVGRTIGPGDSIVVRAVYTPAGYGARNVGLTLRSSAGNGSSVFVPFDIRNDSLALEPLADSIDFGTSLLCDGPPPRRIGFVNRSTIGVSTVQTSWRTPALGGASVESRSYAPGDTLWVDLTLDAGATGAVRDSLRVVLPECPYIVSIPIRADRLRASLAADADTLDFGALDACDSLRTRNFGLRNDGDVPDSMTVLHAPAGPFALDVSGLPAVLASGSTIGLAADFRPASGGAFLDSVVVRSEPCGVVRRVILRGSFDAARPALGAAAVDFGAVTVGARAVRTVWIVNRSLKPYTLGTLVGGASSVTVLRPAAGTVIAPGDSVLVELAYEPTVAGDTLRSAAAIVVEQPCGDTLVLLLAGTGERERAKVALRWADDSANVGADVLLRLMLDQGATPVTDDTLAVIASLQYDPTVIRVSAVEPGLPALAVAGVVQDGLAGELQFETRGLMPASGVIALVRCRIMLGRADTSLLAFARAEARRAATGANLPLTDTGGVFRVLGICRTGGDRLISAGGLLRLAAPWPHPVGERGAIEFETVESGRVVLALNDGAGREIATLLDAERAPGVHRVSFDASNLPSGVYALVLRSGVGLVRTAIVVAR